MHSRHTHIRWVYRDREQIQMGEMVCDTEWYRLPNELFHESIFIVLWSEQNFSRSRYYVVVVVTVFIGTQISTEHGWNTPYERDVALIEFLFNGRMPNTEHLSLLRSYYNTECGRYASAISI